MDDEEIASAREPSQHATLASVESAVEMGMDRIDVLLALFVAKCNEDLAMEYLVGGILAATHPSRQTKKTRTRTAMRAFP